MDALNESSPFTWLALFMHSAQFTVELRATTILLQSHCHEDGGNGWIHFSSLVVQLV